MNIVHKTLSCIVCLQRGAEVFFSEGGTAYLRCGHCHARFMDPACRLDRQAEHAHYLTHENEADDEGYRRFVGRLTNPLIERLAGRSRVLDYGCGPSSAAGRLCAEAGHEVEGYDPFFTPGKARPQGLYHAVLCSEVAEHFHEPAAEFTYLAARLAPGGVLGILTCFQTDDLRFANWHYRRDPTHVVFYRVQTLAFIAETLGLKVSFPEKDVALMQRPC